MADADMHGLILSEFENMRIEHGRLEQTFTIFNNLRVTKRRAPYQPKRWSSIFAPTGSGKSTAIRMYLENVVAKEAIKRGLFPADMESFEIAARQKIVLHITRRCHEHQESHAIDFGRLGRFDGWHQVRSHQKGSRTLERANG
jgi:ABC-type cobalamin/Fe3+-siderophores transport system ATPase subunit